MKHLIWVILLMMTIVSCEKELLLDNSENDGQTSLVTSRLSITTRASNDDGQLQAVAQGRVYVFNAQDQCISVLQTTAEEGTFSTELPIGTYTLYAVGADDLDRYVLPTQEEATPASLITCAENKEMDDLLLKKSDVTLVKNASQHLSINLSRKVLCLNQVEIKNVPTEVTAVEVSLSPMYSGVCLDGTYSEANPQTCTVPLTNQGEGLWQSEPKTYLFPSKGTPTITISFTTPEGTQSYSYSTNQTLEANHHVILSGTYEGHQGVSLTGVLLSEEWGENITITFGFDDPTVTPDPDPDPNPTDTPVPGTFYHDYYVVSVNQTNHKAVLLSKNDVAHGTSEKSDEKIWKGILNTALAQMEIPSGLNCDQWRVPTYEEASIFLVDKSAVGLSKKTTSFFCMIEGVLGYIIVQEDNNTREIFGQGKSCNDKMILRPVIDITY